MSIYAIRQAENTDEATDADDAQTIRFGPFCLSPTRQTLLEAGNPVHIGARAYDLLTALIERAGEVVTKVDLIARVWPSVRVEEGNLRTQMALLRKALRDGEDGARYLVTVPGRGYRFVAPISAPMPRKPQERPAHPAQATRKPLLRLTRLVGRAEAVADVIGRLDRARFVTVTGPGGIGKSSVALAVAEQLADSYGDGIAVVDCAPLLDTSLVAERVAATLGIAIAQDNPTQGLIAFLRNRRMLLVLDSCERVIEAAASLIEDVLRGTPNIDVLATSREPLRAEGEGVYRLPPLEIPPSTPALAATDALGYPAVELFVERATSANHRFELRDADVSVVSEICRKLDGIPLAIELAAGRVDVFGMLGVATRLEDRIRLLTQGRRTALLRHKTLEATLDWSFEMLSKPEQTLLSRLAVFAGDFTLDAAQAVSMDGLPCTADDGELVANLVSKSLLNADINTGFAVYRLLDTTRAYALQKLRESGEFDECSRKHATYLKIRLERTATEGAGAVAIALPDVDDARVALDWAFHSAGNMELGVALASACLPLWAHFSLAGDCCRYVEQALHALKRAHKQDDLVEMRLLAALAAALIYTKGPGLQANAAWVAALAIAEAHRDADYEIRILWGMWSSLFNSGQYLDSLDVGKRFRDAATRCGDDQAALVGDRIVAVSMFYLGDHTGALQTIESMLQRYVRPRDRSDIIRFQFDQRVVALTVRARLLWALGFLDRSMQEVTALIDEAASVDHAMSVCLALAQAACPITLSCGDVAAADRYIALLAAHSAQHGLSIWAVWGKCFSATLLTDRGETDKGFAALCRALDELPQGAFYMRYTGFQGTLAQALGHTGAIASGLTTIDDVLTRCGLTNERWYIAECTRIKGELLRLRRTPDGDEEVRKQFVCAIGWALEMQTPSWELRAATSLARLLRDQGRVAEAQDALAPVYRQFAEGFRTEDLRIAQDLLHQLSSRPEATRAT